MTIVPLLLAVSLAAAPPPEPEPDASVPDAAVAPADAQTRGAPYALRYHPVVDPIVAGAAAAAWVTTEYVLKDELAPKECRWCDRGPDGEDRLNGFDAWGRGARWAEPDGLKTAKLLSDVLGYAVVPLSMGALDVILASRAGDPKLAIQDIVIVIESTMLAQLVTQTVKFTAARERPFYYALTTPQERAAVDDPADAILSFFSGHTTSAFAIATSAATLADLRGYEGSAIVWAVGLPLAAMTAYFRVAADRHYLTDVLVGAVVGSAFGIGVPRLFHGRVLPEAMSLRVVPTSNGAAVFGLF